MHKATQTSPNYYSSEPKDIGSERHPGCKQQDPACAIQPLTPVCQFDRSTMSCLAPPAFTQIQTPAGRRSETVLFVDCRIRYERLIVEGIDPRAKVYRLSRGGNPLSEIAAIVSGIASVGRIAILVRGDTAPFKLSGQRIERETLEREAISIARIRAALKPGADVSLMSCATGAYRVMQDFIAGLEAGLGVPVHAAETDLGTETGQSLSPSEAIIFAPSAQASYPERLLTPDTVRQ